MPAESRGFTLMELLVVTAIIGILASLLLSGFAKAKDQGRRIKCISNHRQLMVTFTLYSDDNNNELVSNDIDAPRPNWVESSLHGPTPGFVERAALVDPGRAAFGRYLPAPDVYKCPSERTTYALASRRAEKLRSYSMNHYLKNRDDPAAVGAKPPRPLSFLRTASAFQKPSELFVFIDAEPVSVCTTAFMIPPSNTDSFYTAPGAMHARKFGVLSFADGHSEAHRWMNPILRDSLAMTNSPHPAPGSDPKDVAYIRAHAHHLAPP
jgi:prepilin-type N-terminal cleavage/methylation domain-containing protein